MVKSRVTLTTCLLCILVFLLELASGGSIFNCSAETLLNLGASTGPLTIGQLQLARLLSCIFLHASLLHLALNVYVLVDFGPMAEVALGRKLYLFIFFFSGVVGALTSILYNPTQTSVGASAAILGLLGALIYKNWFQKDGAKFSRPQLIMLCIFLLYSLLLGFTTDIIDNSAHLGGFFAGMLACAAFFGRQPDKAISRRRAVTTLLLLMAVIPLLIFAARTRLHNNPDVAAFQYREEAFALIKKDDYTQALIKLNAAQNATHNKFSSILFDRAEVLDHLDQDQAALADIDLWLAHDKIGLRSLLLRANILHKLGQDGQAIDCISQALELKNNTIMDFFNTTPKPHGGQALLYNNRAWFKLSSGNAKEALADCDKSLSIDAKLATAYDTRGVAYLMLKDLPQAEKDFSHVIELSSSDKNAKRVATESGAGYYHRAIIRLALGDKAGAQQDMDRFKTLDYKPEAWEPKP